MRDGGTTGASSVRFVLLFSSSLSSFLLFFSVHYNTMWGRVGQAGTNASGSDNNEGRGGGRRAGGGGTKKELGRRADRENEGS